MSHIANNYYEGTGTLSLGRVTPIITALFGGFSLDAAYPGNGKAYIAISSKADRPDWDTIARNLADLAPALGIALDEGTDIVNVLNAYARHYQCEQDESLKHLLEWDVRPDEEPEPESLCLIATLFDDGHKLTALCFEGSWYCSHPCLFQFGGDVRFSGREFTLCDNTSEILIVAQALNRALARKDDAEASILIALQTFDVLRGIRDAQLREAVKRNLVEQLSGTIPKPITP
jgi:hypothetical protein